MHAMLFHYPIQIENSIECTVTVTLLVNQALPAGDVPQIANPIAPQDIIGGAVEVRNPDLPDFLLHKY